MVAFEDVREVATQLPDVVECTWYGAAAFRVGLTKRSAVFARMHEKDTDLLLLKVGVDERLALLAERPDRFMASDHPPDRDDSVLMRLSATTNAELDEVAELLALAHERMRSA